MDIKLEMEQCDINIKPLSDSMIIVLSRLSEEKIKYDGSFIQGLDRFIEISVLDNILSHYNCFLSFEGGDVFLMEGNFNVNKRVNMSDSMKEDIIDAYVKYVKQKNK